MSLIGITMGCPVGIGPEIILRFFNSFDHRRLFSPIVIGDMNVLTGNADRFGLDLKCTSWLPGQPVPTKSIPVFEVSNLTPQKLKWGRPDEETGRAMAAYIKSGVKLIEDGALSGIATCPIAKIALHNAGYNYPGHTEMLADLTGTKHFAMMMAGTRLRVTLVTIHCAFADIVPQLTQQAILRLLRMTYQSLLIDFGIAHPRIGVAGLNPHAGEEGLFGKEEQEIIAPAVTLARKEGIDAKGPFPADTIFYQASTGRFDTVVSMYHDQGLIPFKLLHFSDGVNVTIGLPIVRTSVDHGTAYDIAGKGIADPRSLTAAIELAAKICLNRKKYRQLPF
jgi:4-hydroxythreonine-4-phosphate dehydrogenase